MEKCGSHVFIDKIGVPIGGSIIVKRARLSAVISSGFVTFKM